MMSNCDCELHYNVITNCKHGFGVKSSTSDLKRKHQWNMNVRITELQEMVIAGWKRKLPFQYLHSIFARVTKYAGPCSGMTQKAFQHLYVKSGWFKKLLKQKPNEKDKLGDDPLEIFQEPGTKQPRKLSQ